MMIGSQLKRWRLQLGSVLIFSCVLPLAVWAQGANQDAEEQLAEAGQQALAAGQYAVARTNFEKLAKLQPGIAEVHATLASSTSSFVTTTRQSVRFDRKKAEA